tara:strand:+ start:532 stop:804 length:273 start_codon:yes stop_codon:yes gene_type:complete
MWCKNYTAAVQRFSENVDFGLLCRHRSAIKPTGSQYNGFSLRNLYLLFFRFESIKFATLSAKSKPDPQGPTAYKHYVHLYSGVKTALSDK